MSTLGTFIRGMRNTKGMNQKTLARKVDVTPSHISAIECGENLPSDDLCERLGRALDVALPKMLHKRRQDKKGTYGEPAPDGGDGGGDDDLPPWEQDPDGWERCSRRRARRLGLEQVTIRKRGEVYMSDRLAREAGLDGGVRVDVLRGPDGGGLQRAEDGEYLLGDESQDKGYLVSGNVFDDWVDGESVRAPVQDYGDGWVAFERPEGDGR